MLRLLDPASDLRLMVMEDLHPGEPPGVDPRLLLGVDLTEYYGGESLADARRVVVSQLKYSHRRPTRAWTAARVGQGSGNRPGVTKRLADIYRALARPEQGDRTRVLEVLEIRLVSNQPIGTRLACAMDVAKSWLEGHPDAVTASTLLARIDPGARTDIKRLYVDSGLDSRAFTDFLRVLVLDGGQLERAEQELALTEALATHVAAGLEHHSRSLYDLVRRRAQPEGVDWPVRVEDVVAALHVGGVESLLPAPAHFSLPAHVIDTPDALRILEALRQSPDRRVMAHGDAGVGKTTSVLSLVRHLPPGSAVVVFDCFAGGDYLAPAHARHVPERALLQLCNELAVQCRLPLLVVPPASTYDLWREFQRRLQHAAETLADVGAQLLVVLDAIDNSAHAARERRDESFVPDLWTLEVPSNAGLIATARTARLNQLALPEGITRVTLSGFDEQASAAHLRRRFPDADVDAAREFHIRSNGNPRVQFYVLDAAREDPPTTAQAAVEEARLTPEALFEDLWRAAVVHAPDPDAAIARLADLLCLTAPKRLEHLAGTAKVDLATVEAFCRELAPGLVLRSGVASLQDEDFEKFLQDKVAPQQWQQAHGRLADYFASLGDDPYAETVLAEHLIGAERVAELVRLAIDVGQPQAVSDPLARLQVYFRRIRLALGVSADPAGRLAASQLLVLAADAAISDQAVAAIIRDRPDLALRYGDPEAVAAVWRDERNLDWHGPIHMRRAALAAKQGRDSDARQELRSANAWLARRHEEEEYQRWNLHRSDVAAAIEARYWLDGWDAAQRALRHWRPWAFVFDVSAELVSRLRHDVEGTELVSHVLGTDVPPQLRARMLAAARPKPDDVAENDLTRLANRLVDAWTRPEHRAGRWPMDFIELVARVVNEQRLIDRLLDAVGPRLPRRAPERYEGFGEFELPLRAAALRATFANRKITLDELSPASIASPDAESAVSDVEEQKRAMNAHVRPWLEIFRLRASALVGQPRVKTPATQLRAEIGERSHAAKHAWHEPSHTYSHWLGVACDVLLAARGTDLELVATAADAAVELSGAGDVHAWTTMARTLAEDGRYRDSAMVLLDRAAAVAESRPQRASELADFLLDLAELATPHDRDLASDLYNRAVAAREGLDDEGVARLQMHARLAPMLAGRPAADEYAERIARSVVAYRSRVSEEDRLPWRETLEAAAVLHPPSGLTLMARWEDQRHLHLGASVPCVVPACVSSGLISARDGLALDAYLSGPGFSRTAAALLDRILTDDGRLAAGHELERMSLRIRRDAAGAGRAHAAEKLRDWARNHGFAQRDAISALDLYIEHVPPDDDAGRSPYRRAERDTAIEGILANAPSCRPEELAARLAALRASHASESQRAEFLRRGTSSVPPSQRVAVLDELTSFASDDAQMRFGAETIFATLSELMERWAGSTAVTTWREAHLRPFLLAQLPNAVRYADYHRAGLAEFVRLAGTGIAAGLVIEGAARHIDELPAGGLYALAATLGAALEPNDIERLLDWSLATLEDGEPPPPTVGALAREPVLSGVLWSLFANPDKSVRWGAAHVTRRLLAETDGDRLAAELLAAYRRRDGGLFADATHDFLWMSAQVWLMMTLARVAGDRPEVVAPIGGDLAAIALDNDWPHASVREFARRAALRVADHRTSLISPTIVEALAFANRPRSSFPRREHRYGRLGAGDRGEARWHFSMDVERYWFGSLGQYFREPQDDMLRRGERWIVDVLGVPTAIRPRRDDPRIAHVEYGDLDTHHGGSPAVESSRTAVEYCALMLTAGELVDEGRPVLVERYDPVTDPWDDWLDEHLDAYAAHWISDVREPTPPDPLFLRAHITSGAWPDLNRTEFTERLAEPASETILVDAYIDYSSAAAYGHDWLDSALVAPATAEALLRALELADDMSFFALPKEPHEDGYAEHQIDEGPFRLIGWIRELQNYTDGLEHHDPLARISLTTALPGSSFREFHAARLLSDERTLVDRAGNRVAWMRSFSDVPSDRRDRYRTDITVSGRQTFAQTDALLRYLRATGMHLIIKGHADRRDGDPYHRPRQRDDDRVQELNRAILIEHSGRIRRVEGRRIIG